MPTVGSLFSGAGGLDLGFDRAGFRCLWQVECDPTANDVRKRHWPHVEHARDVAGMSRLPKRFGDWRDRYERPDVIVGGFPCQDLSVAGKRVGLSGNRSGLWWQMLRVISGLRPCCVVWENVPGLLSSDSGRDFARVVFSLGERGYFGAWRVLDAQFFGVPQRRRRVFGVFFDGRSGAGRAAEVLALAGCMRGDTPACGEAGQDVAGTLGGGTAGRGWSDDLDRAGAFAVRTAHTLNGSPEAAFGQCHGSNVGAVGTLRKGNGNATGGVPFVAFAQNQRDEVRDLNGLAGSLAAEPGMKQQTYLAACQTRREGKGPDSDATNGNLVFNWQAAGKQTTLGLSRLPGALGTGQVPAVTHSLTASGFDASEDGTGRGTPLVPVAFQESQTGVREYADAGTLRADGPGHDPVGTRIRAGSAVRRLMPVECERLMGWPPGFTEFGASGARIADGPRYRLCGNGVVAPVAEWIARRLMAVLEGGS